MKPLLIIKCGEKLPTLAHVGGGFEDWIVAGMEWRDRVMICKVYEGETLPDVNGACGVVITGSGAMVTDDLPWVESTISWLHRAFSSDVPILGICFGHQLLAKALGGDVNDNPNGVEVGTVRMHVLPEQDSLFAGLPDHIHVQVSHQQAVLALPDAAVRLATTDMDANHAFRFGDMVWGIQFHPEFDKAIVEKYMAFYQAKVGENLKVNPARAMTESTKILQRFARRLVS